MSRARHKLTATKVKNWEAGTIYDGGGLQLQKQSKSHGRWIFRYSFFGRRRDMGLGTYPVVSLAGARISRDHWEEVKLADRDPIEVRNQERAKLLEDRSAYDPTLEEAVTACLEHRKSTLKKGGLAGRWRSPLDMHAVPLLGKRRVSTLTTNDIKRVIEPLWVDHHPTAEKLYQRLRLILKHCVAHEINVDPEIVDKALGQLPAVAHQTESIKATPWQDVPALYQKLSKPTSSHMALRLLILTVVRADSVCGARFEEIDGNVWIVPPLRVKGKEGKTEEFRVPLALEAMRIVDNCSKRSRNSYLFPGHRNKPICGNALLEALNDLDEPGRPHGFRSSFKDWSRENHPGLYEISETSLAHKIGNKTERSYQRSDLLEPRRALMKAWADYVTGSS
ncbi:integrase arm-type DNA-binding domain-containing protein [Leisingera sp. SS27]|uniref:tyrosine-type recombinase/integrase n=1 Tax=Leisingera sp. SS27 TaxID=2979462 RepID=UPI00232CA763|nr:integrase arm-type DNA-binding domain-containing protein [Leisingera sp. SS27]MDC0657408.1 integrase arm-type DNA-binding domain-containing protein [Leisingera sp. SS27]